MSVLATSLESLARRIRGRHSLFPAIVATEVFLATIFLRGGPPNEVDAPRGPTLVMFNLPAAAQTRPAQAQARPAQVSNRPVEPPRIVVVPAEAPAAESALVAAPVFDAAAAAMAGFGTTCDVAYTLERGFGGDPLLSAELARIGPQSRSVANAIMVWDGQWVELSGGAPQDAVQTVRRAIVEAVRAAPPECLNEKLAGPRFVAVSRSDVTTVLVLGSGEWRWEQLLVESLDGPPASGVAS